MKTTTTLILILFSFNMISAQQFKFYHTNNTPRIIRPGSENDTLLNAFAGGLNTPQFSNIDWNNDGKKDLFVFDKSARKVYSYVFENGKFVYKPQYEAGFPFYLFGFANLKDQNLDGKPDLFTAAFIYNGIDSTLVHVETMQLYDNKTTNSDHPVFIQNANMIHDTGYYAGYPWNQKIPKSPIPAVSSAYPGIDDMDGDGDIDILTNVGVIPYNLYYENLRKNKMNVPFPNESVVYIMRDQCWGYMAYNYNNSFSLGLRKEDDELTCSGLQTWGKKERSKHADQSILLIDLNGDGIKDIVIGDYEYKSFISLTNGRLQNSMQADSIISQDTLFLSQNNQRKQFIEYPSAYMVDITGDNKQEMLVSTNSITASRSVNNIWSYDVTRNGSKLDFTALPGDDFLYKDMLDLGMRSVPVFIDIDGDGDKDLIIATSGVLEQTNNNNDRLYLYLNITDSLYPVYKLSDSNFANISGGSQGFFFAHPTFGDLNGDGKPDMLIGEGNGNIAYFENTTATPGQYTFNLVHRNAFGILAGTYVTPQLIDLDKDGLLDIVAGNTAGTIKYYKNKGTLNAPIFSAEPDIDSLGKIVTKEIFKAIGKTDMVDLTGHSAPHLADIDNDGKYELLTGSTNGKLQIYTNIYPVKDSVARLAQTMIVDFGKPNSMGYDKRFGARNSITTAYLDGDNFLDIVMGNIAGGLTYLNTNNFYNGLDKKVTEQILMEIYPNPASGVINLNSGDLANGYTYEIFDISGKKVKEGKVLRDEVSNGIDITAMDMGMYFINVKTRNNSGTVKFIISR